MANITDIISAIVPIYFEEILKNL